MRPYAKMVPPYEVRLLMFAYMVKRLRIITAPTDTVDVVVALTATVTETEVKADLELRGALAIDMVKGLVVTVEIVTVHMGSIAVEEGLEASKEVAMEIDTMIEVTLEIIIGVNTHLEVENQSRKSQQIGVQELMFQKPHLLQLHHHTMTGRDHLICIQEPMNLISQHKEHHHTIDIINLNPTTNVISSTITINYQQITKLVLKTDLYLRLQLQRKGRNLYYQSEKHR